MMFKIELDNDAGKVISLAVVRERAEFRKSAGRCSHANVMIDQTLDHISCDDCKEKLNPMAYICLLIEKWEHVQRLIDTHTRAEKYATNGLAELEKRARCRCDHCGRTTKIRLHNLHAV